MAHGEMRLYLNIEFLFCTFFFAGPGLEFLSQDLVLYYFSAHWCPPCRQFTPMLKDFYEVLLLYLTPKTNTSIILNSHQEAEGIEIVFVSSDRSAEDMASYMKVMTPQIGKSIKTT